MAPTNPLISEAIAMNVLAIITLLSICHLNHRQSYLNIAAITMGAPLVALVVVITLGTMFGSF